MKPITLGGLAPFVGATALVLSMSTVAQAQTGSAPLAQAQTAGEKRLQEVIEVLNTGDYAKTRAYFEANSVDVRTDVPGVKPGSWNETTFATTLDRFRASRGYDLVRVTTVPARRDIAVVGIVRNRTTWDEEYLAVRVEPQAPHRITWFPAIGGQDLAALGLKPAASVAVTEQERLQEIGSYLKRMADADLFSGAIVIARDGKPVFAQGYGYANREKKIPNTVDTPFLMASMTKPFTGLAIGQLVEQGKLSYDDRWRSSSPIFPIRKARGRFRSSIC